MEVQRAVAGPALHPPLSDERLRAWALAALAGRRRRAELTLRLVDEPEMVRLNAAFRGRQGPTNVLAFPFEPGLPPGVPMDPPLLGDVVLCLPVALREAWALGRAPHFHLAHLVVHGVLHLLGHDHHEEAEARRMEAAEAQVLQGLGFPHPYGGGAEEQAGAEAGEEAGAGRPAGRGGEARGGSA
ncbi:MAG: rRNA maturation RNase YbeY [Gammaproteobacteria bacterium]|nr:MAG: rRNA maturation RNase YbeY [Gammaproteobacteria bacterium]